MQPLGQGISGSTSNWGGSEYGGAGDDAAAAKRLKKMGAGVAEIEEECVSVSVLLALMSIPVPLHRSLRRVSLGRR